MTAPADESEWMRMQARAMYVFDGNGRIAGFNEPEGKIVDCPLVFLGRTAAGNVSGIRWDVPQPVADEITTLLSAEPAHANEGAPQHASDVRRLIGSCAAWTIEWSGPAFRFGPCLPRVDDGPGEVRLLGPEDADAILDVFPRFRDSVGSRAPFAALVENGRVRSIGYAATGRGSAVEAGVDTVEASRGRGFAPRVVAAWAAEMQRMGRTPLYSTSWSNTASRAVARKLDLVQYGTDWHLR